jgi:hypothetical protein
VVCFTIPDLDMAGNLLEREPLFRIPGKEVEQSLLEGTNRRLLSLAAPGRRMGRGRV